MSRTQMRKAVFAGAIAAVTILGAKPVHASYICNSYGSCKICDFYGPDGSWRGSISNCQD
jgi:hypothetical protein